MASDCQVLLQEIIPSLAGKTVLNLNPSVCCSTSAILCNSARQIVSLELNSWGLTGTIPGAISKLTQLEYLDFSSNNLTGVIPESIGGLSSLTVLDLSSNKLDGQIPSSITLLKSLLNLDLSSNHLSSSIPTNIGDMASLGNLCLSNNGLTGSIPDSIGTLDDLQAIWLGSNQLSGPVPASIGGMVTLQELQLINNQLVGPLPPAVADLPNFKTFLKLGTFQSAIPSTFPFKLVLIVSAILAVLSSMTIWLFFLKRKNGIQQKLSKTGTLLRRRSSTSSLKHANAMSSFQKYESDFNLETLTRSMPGVDLETAILEQLTLTRGTPSASIKSLPRSILKGPVK